MESIINIMESIIGIMASIICRYDECITGMAAGVGPTDGLQPHHHLLFQVRMMTMMKMMMMMTVLMMMMITVMMIVINMMAKMTIVIMIDCNLTTTPLEFETSKTFQRGDIHF